MSQAIYLPSSTKDLTHTDGTRLDTKINSLVSALGVKRDYHARGDAQVATTGSCASGITTLTVTNANFTSADVGKMVGIPYAGADDGVHGVGQTFVSTIASVTDATHVVLAAAPVKTIGAARTVTDASINANSTNLTSATANWMAGDIGKTVVLPNSGDLQANSGGSPLVTKIVSITSSTVAVVAQASTATVSGQTVTIPGAWVEWGTDDTAALQNAFNAGMAQKRPVELEPGRYLTTAVLTAGSFLHLVGHGSGMSILSPVMSGASAIEARAASAPAPYTDMTFDNFEIDGSGTRATSYSTVNKGMYITHLKRGRWTNLYIHDTAATGLGCDFLPYGHIVNNVVDRCGAQVPEFGNGGGGSGIGIGTGYDLYEPLDIIGNHVTNCGNNGIFVESQSSNVASKGIRIIGNFCLRNNGDGIGDHGTDGTLIQGNTCERNGFGIRATSGFVAGLYSSNGIIQGNSLYKNGIYVSIKSGVYTVTDNYINGGSAGYGIIFLPVDTVNTITGLTISRNSITASGGRGIQIQNGLYDRLYIEGNHVWNCGVSTSQHRNAIETNSSIGSLYVRNNVCYDDRAVGSKTQSYGFQATTGTIGQLVMDGNDFGGNADGTSDTSGATVTTLVSHFNP